MQRAHMHTSDWLSDQPLLNQWEFPENICFLLEQVPLLSFTES